MRVYMQGGVLFGELWLNRRNAIKNDTHLQSNNVNGKLTWHYAAWLLKEHIVEPGPCHDSISQVMLAPTLFHQ